MVFEREGRSADDPWGTGGPQFASRFRPGIDFNGGASPSLDTQAKYLYLYQVVNHQRTDPTIESASIKLLADLSDITSWGYFQGLGLATEEDTGLRPLSANHKLDPNTYSSPAPAVPISKPLRLATIPTTRGEEPAVGAGKLVRIHWDAFDPARTPDYVMLLARSDFEENSSFRAIWSGPNAIAKDGRSTVFGFTTNLPPKFDQARLRTSRDHSKGAEVPAGLEKEEETKISKEGKTKLASARDSVVGVEGQAPTPIPAAPVGGIGLASLSSGSPRPIGAAPFPTLFAPVTTPSASSGGGFGFPFVGQRQTSIPQSFNGGFGGGFGSGSGTTVIATGTNANINITIALSQSQQQQQQQFQGQGQGQSQRQNNGHGGRPTPPPPGNVIPEPATILGSGMGLVTLLAWSRRRNLGPKTKA